MNTELPQGAGHSDISLRPLTDGDAVALHASVHSSMATLSQWLPWATLAYGHSDAQAWIAHCIAAREAEHEYHFGIFDAGSGDLLGGVGLNHRIPAYRCANMGYWVTDSARGSGLAVAAARQAARFGFDTLDLQRIAILIQPENHASLRVAAKLGAVREGVARHGIVVAGSAHDAIVHSLLPSDLLHGHRAV